MDLRPLTKFTSRLAGMSGGASLMLAGIATVSLAEQSPNLTTLGEFQLMDEVRSFAISGDYAYLGSDHDLNGDGWGGLWIVDISDRSAPLYVSHLNFPDVDVDDVALAGDYAFVADGGSDQFYVVDVSEPANPSVVQTVTLDRSARRIEVVGNIAYVTSRGHGLVTYDISDPTNPLLLGQVNYPYAATFRISGDRAYCGNALDEFLVIDISDLSNPTILSQTDVNFYSHDIEVSGNLAYIGAGSDNLRILDLSDELNPQQVASLAVPGDLFGVEIVGAQAFLSTSSGLGIYDLTDPLAPVLVSQLAGNSRATIVIGNELFRAGAQEGFDIVDITDTSNPQQIGEFETGAALLCVDVIDENYTYAGTGEGGVWIMDTSDPSNPVPISRVPNLSAPRLSALVDDLYYVVASVNGIEGLFAYDVSVPDAPMLLGGSQRSEYEDFDVDGSTVWAAHNDGVYVLDFADPSNVTDLGSWFDYWDFAYSCLSQGDHLYVADGYYLDVLDVSDPSAPALVHRYELSDGYAEAILIDGNHLYAYGDSYLNVFDISDPMTPTVISTTEFATSSGREMRLQDGHLFIAADRENLLIVDVTDPMNPSLTAFFDIDNGYGQGVDVHEGRVYLANDSSLMILELDVAANVATDLETLSQPRLLEQNSPNPFAPRTTIGFRVPANGATIRLEIFDTQGRRVTTLVDGRLGGGRQEVSWDGRSESGAALSSGIYLYRLQVEDHVETRKMTVRR